MLRTCCPRCGSERYKKNGHIHNGKQKYRCHVCGRQFVKELDKKVIDDTQKALIRRLLLT